MSGCCSLRFIFHPNLQLKFSNGKFIDSVRVWNEIYEWKIHVNYFHVNFEKVFILNRFC